MKYWLWALAGLGLMLAVAGCSGNATAPTSTPRPPTSTPLPAVAPTSTPFPSKEWALEDIRVNGSTVTVLVRVYAGVDVWVTLDGREPDRVDAPLPILEFVFQNVAPGERSVEIQDVVGHSMIAELLVPKPSSSD
ncbi:MAG: hypothetical protein QF467_00930 [SAR202 cluster bacterium]|jgi:hypothetical protein|nr:hypothetical protein [SAR202 cluster bacterium]